MVGLLFLNTKISDGFLLSANQPALAALFIDLLLCSCLFAIAPNHVHVFTCSNDVVLAWC